MSDRELMQQALEAIERSLNYFDQLTYLREQTAPLRNKLLFSSQDLRARLAEPDDEPVAWLHTMDSTEGIEGNEPQYVLSFDAGNPFGIPGEDYSETYPVTSEPLYTSPAARKVQPLTPVQIARIATDCALVTPSDLYFARAIERAHGITGDSHE